MEWSKGEDEMVKGDGKIPSEKSSMDGNRCSAMIGGVVFDQDDVEEGRRGRRWKLSEVAQEQLL